MSGNKELVVAAEKGNLERVQQLLAQRADVESRNPDKDNSTALIETGVNGRTDITQALLAAGANFNATDESGRTALHFAGDMGHTATAQALLAAGANTDAKDSRNGSTALHFAGVEEHTATAQALLAAGANPEAKDIYGQTALGSAIGETRKLLEEAAKVKDVVSRADQGRLTTADKSSLDSVTEAEYWTPLLFASARGLQTAVKNVLESKASVDKPNKAINVSDGDVNAS
eukprot:g18488.t1